MFSTVRLVASNGSTGTGFFFQYDYGPDKKVPVIITNKHVVNFKERETVRFFLHEKLGTDPGEENIDIEFDTRWIFHKTQDLCFCYLAPLFLGIHERQKKEVFFVPLTENLIWSQEKLEELTAVEDVIMVGYPSGLWDERHNLPLFRKGITASHPAIDFNNENIGVMDMACFPGSSGSPVFIMEERGYVNKQGTFHVGGKRVVLLGVLFQGPQLNARGDIVVENIPTQQKISALTPVMINIGYYIKAKELLVFKPEIEKELQQQKK
jgi:hypothetical protein